MKTLGRIMYFGPVVVGLWLVGYMTVETFGWWPIGVALCACVWFVVAIHLMLMRSGGTKGGRE